MIKQTLYFRILLILAFGAIYFIWGTTYLANLFALRSFPPFILSAFRYLSAAVLLGGYAACTGLRWPPLPDIKVLAISGVLMLVGGSGLVAYAQLYIGSGYAAAIIATEPLWFVLLDRKRWKLYLSNAWVLTGLAVGFAGTVGFSILGPGGEGAGSNSHWTGTLLLLLGSVFWVIGTLYADRNLKAGTSNVTGSAVQLVAGSGISMAVASMRNEWTDFSWADVSAEAWGGFAYLVVMGSLAAFLAFNWLVKVQPPAIVSTHTFVNPVVAIFMGWLIAGEQITLLQAVALAGVFIGVIVIQVNKQKEAND